MYVRISFVNVDKAVNKASGKKSFIFSTLAIGSDGPAKQTVLSIFPQYINPCYEIIIIKALH